MADSYLRRFKSRHFKQGIFSPEAFECSAGESGLSLHKREPPLDSDAGLSSYQVAYAYPSGDLLGISELVAACFVGMNLPIPTPPACDEPYADLHFELRPCPDGIQAAQLAACANLLLPYTRA